MRLFVDRLMTTGIPFFKVAVEKVPRFSRAKSLTVPESGELDRLGGRAGGEDQGRDDRRGQDLRSFHFAHQYALSRVIDVQPCCAAEVFSLSKSC